MYLLSQIRQSHTVLPRSYNYYATENIVMRKIISFFFVVFLQKEKEIFLDDEEIQLDNAFEMKNGKAF